MLESLSKLKAEYEPYPVHPQTIIVGTNESRTAFSETLEGVLHTIPNAIICDLHILNSIQRQPDWRYIAVVSSAAELYTITKAVQTVAPIHSTNFVVLGVNCDLKQGVALRTAALNELDTPGLILVQEENGRAQQVFKDILHTWRESTDDNSVLPVWGEASLARAKDMIIPPKWDSEGKIRAVVDAAGEDYDALVGTSSWGTQVEPPQIELLTEQKQEQLRAEGRRKKAEFIQRYKEWGARMQELADRARHKPGDQVSDVDNSSTSDRAPAQADFFQKLLAGTR